MDKFLESLISVKPTKKQMDWQKLEFTAFFHYGINSFTDREWGKGDEDISIFDPKKLDTDQWCESIKLAGINACIITAKHHDGFCLWDTKYTKHSVMNTPLKVDIVDALSKSCKKYGLKFGIYLSPWDRHEETYGQGEKYDDYFCNQLTELMTKYGELYTLWFDGACGEGPNGKIQSYDWDRYYKLIRELQPNAVISISGPDVRWCGNEAGDCRDSEWSVVPRATFSQAEIAENSQQSDDTEFRTRKINQRDSDLGSREVLENVRDLIWYPAEVDTSIRPGWFYHESEDDKVRTVEELTNIYLKSVGGNAVLLLNIPPHKEGYITDFDRVVLSGIGEFIENSFSNNFSDKATVTATNTDFSSAKYNIDNVKSEDDYYWKAQDFCEETMINIKFDGLKSIKYIVIKEEISQSQRVEQFEIEANINGKFQNIYKGTTIGYKKICELGNIEVTDIRIKFTSFRVAPLISFVGIY